MVVRQAAGSGPQLLVKTLDINREGITMTENISRRQMLSLTAATVGGVTALTGGARAGTVEQPGRDQPEAGSPRAQNDRPYWERSYSGGPVQVKPLAPGLPRKDYKPVVVPTGYTLPFKIVDGVKVFHVIAEEVDHAFDSGLRAKCWAYNGHVNSTMIEALEGERVRIYVTNRLPIATRSTGTGSISPTAWTAWLA